ncbi:thioredoxin family protein [Hydrocarboniclastica marina]|uniref:Co-chaperone YbbN n=1 Tax=Hydrocarboniclastica marina TaxID=2259620 RepID=A0A4V1D8Z3_9ALTE|nr:co-chaperone YbbN [Hydrocarboniclastica marina]QCF26890.1 co-chaperone YbbN [Hydrocarboniclastica marina]
MAETYVFDATLENFQTDVIDASSQVPVVVDVWAEWCAPCKQLMPILQKLADEFKGGFRLAKVNADEQQQLTAHLGVRSLPSVKIVKNGQLVDEFSGVIPESEIRAKLEPHIDKPPMSPRDQAKTLWEEGQLDQALALLTEINQANPEDKAVLIDIALIKVEQGEVAEARVILEGLPKEETFNAHARQLAARIKFAERAGQLPPVAELQARIEADPEDFEARYQLALHWVLKGENAKAMELILSLLRKDRNYADGAARATLVELFDLLGNDDPDVRQYRRKLFTLMY